MNTVNRAIILAAGRGSRLANSAGDLPKCLAPIGGRTILQHQIDCLFSAGVRNIVVVTGYRAELVRAACKPPVECLENRRFFETNSLYSLWLARRFLNGGALVLNGDVLAHPQLFNQLINSPYDDAFLVSLRDPNVVFGEEEMKVWLKDGCLREISKQANGAIADGENVGILKFGPDGAGLLIENLEELIGMGATRDWAPRAFREFARHRPLHAVPTRALPWIEIDFPEDYLRAITEILPQLESDGSSEGRRIAAVAAD